MNQGIFGRAWNFGTLKVGGSGGTHQIFKYIAAPDALVKTIVQQVGGGKTAGGAEAGK